MKLITFDYSDKTRIGVLAGHEVIDLSRADTRIPATMKALIALGDEGLDLVRAVTNSEKGPRYALADVTLRPVVPDPDKIVCIGLNYASHATEANMKLPAEPTVFGKFNNVLIGANAPIIIPRTTDRIDYEAELAVIIGKRAKYVPEAAALDFVYGYSVFNDVSARDYQLSDNQTGQWTLGKSFDASGPIGPALITRDEITDPQNLDIRLSIDGTVLQQSNTRNMIFSVAKIISFLSTVMTLEPGDIIATGTPEGIGFKRNPPVFLRPGNRVSVTIEHLGVLENPVIAE